MKTLEEVERIATLGYLTRLLNQKPNLREWPSEINYTPRCEVIRAVMDCSEIKEGEKLSGFLDEFVTKEIHGTGLTLECTLNDIVHSMNYFTNEGMFCYTQNRSDRDSFLIYYPFKRSIVFKQLITPEHFVEANIYRKLNLEISFCPMLFGEHSFYVFPESSNCNLGVKIVL